MEVCNVDPEESGPLGCGRPFTGHNVHGNASFQR